MADSWKDLEGVTLADKFQLQTLLVENEASACFLVRMADQSRPSGRLRLVLSEWPAEAESFEHGKIAAGLNHPNLAEVWEYGRINRGVTSMQYVLTEPADEDLAAVLQERPLNQVEAREVLLSAAATLSYLHSRSLVHGSLSTAAILATGDRIRLSSDTIVPVYDGGESGDLRALGDCIHAMFTQDPHADPEHMPAVPQPFRDIIRGCYGVNPDEKWTADRILQALDLPAVPAEPVAKAPELKPEPEPERLPAPPPESEKRFAPWMLAPIGAGATLLIILLARNTQPAGPPSASPVASVARVAPAPQRPVLPPPSARTPSEPAQSRIWRVISYTYSRAEDTARMVSEINRKWPQLKAEKFTPAGSGPPYYVALGGRMTRTEAVRLQQRAISSGLPPDTFVRNFKK